MVRFGLLLVAGCSLYTNEPIPDEPAATSHVEIKDIPVDDYRRDVDLLFVVDTTPAMAAFRDQLVASLPHFADAIEMNARLEDLRIGVITANPDDRAQLVGGHYLHLVSVPSGGYRHDFAGALADRLSELAPTDFSAGSSQPLAMVEALLEQPGELARPGAALLIIPITNRDDESPGAIETYVAKIDALAADHVEVAPIYAAPAARIDQFDGAISTESYWTTEIASADWSHALEMLQAFNHVFLGIACFEGQLAVPRQCAFSVFDPSETLAPECDGAISNAPCYELREDATNCGYGSGLAMHMHWIEWPAPMTHVISQCVVESPSN